MKRIIPISLCAILIICSFFGCSSKERKANQTISSSSSKSSEQSTTTTTTTTTKKRPAANTKMIALTYDDGPHPSVTSRIVKTLEKAGAKATFFIVGKRAELYPNQCKEIVNSGSEVANHSYDHSYFNKMTKEEIKSSIGKTDDVIEKACGKRPTLVRPVGGYMNTLLKQTSPHPLIMWSVDTLDWKSRNAQSVKSKILANAYDGAIILMHDLYESTAEATEIIVPELIRQGYTLVTVSELLEIRGEKTTGGTVIFSVTTPDDKKSESDQTTTTTQKSEQSTTITQKNFSDKTPIQTKKHPLKGKK